MLDFYKLFSSIVVLQILSGKSLNHNLLQYKLQIAFNLWYTSKYVRKRNSNTSRSLEIQRSQVPFILIAFGVATLKWALIRLSQTPIDQSI